VRAATFAGSTHGTCFCSSALIPTPSGSIGVVLDNKGFVMTGSDLQLPLATSSPGVFAIGDVRRGSVKRVAAGVGEGAAAVAQIHAYLATLHS
jgi:thioredoxin reductase